MGTEESHVDKSLKGRLLLPALILGTFVTLTCIVFLSTLLVDIASSLKVSIGTASALILIGSFIGLIVALVMGALTVRFKHKSLFLFGVALYGVGALGLFFAPDFATALLSQVFLGAGGSMISIMVYSLIGELLPLEKRGWAVGLNISTMMFVWVVVAPLSGFVESVAGWRLVLPWVVFPTSIACLILGLLVIPSKPRQEQLPPGSLYLEAFKKVLFNKSAVACLIGTALMYFFNTVPMYAVSFYRIQFSVSPAIGGMFSAIAAVGGIFGGAIGGRLVNRYGRKPLTVAAAFVAGVLAILFTFIPNMWASVAFWVASASSVAIGMVALYSLVLEQVPEFRASMMSVNQTFLFIGSILGLTLGGLALNLYANNFQLLMIVFGAAGVVSALVVFLLARDPTKTQLRGQSNT
jgi:DHA1 family inner membrane transport protein